MPYREGSDENLDVPEKLYRGISIPVSELNLEFFSKPLKEGDGLDEDSGKRKDGNESGVYMSTNENMSGWAYTHASEQFNTPNYHDGYMLRSSVDLPMCGILYEIDTAGLDVFRPEITSLFQGVYNNNFEGDEFAVSEVPSESYRVKKLILTTHANDSNKLVVDVNEETTLEDAINQIKERYTLLKAEAEKFKEFLGTLDASQRKNQFAVKGGWQRYQELVSNN